VSCDLDINACSCTQEGASLALAAQSTRASCGSGQQTGEPVNACAVPGTRRAQQDAKKSRGVKRTPQAPHPSRQQHLCSDAATHFSGGSKGEAQSLVCADMPHQPLRKLPRFLADRRADARRW
jgi:hypothetical protein